MAGTKVAAVGECMIELSGAGDDLWRMGFAGDTFNTLWALRALVPDCRPDFVSAFGDDDFSRRQIRFLADNGIGIGASPVLDGARPGLYAITLDGAERSFTYWRADAAARQLATDPQALAESLRERALVYFSGITLAILDPQSRRTLLASLAEARAAGSTIAFDPNYRPRLWSTVETAQAASNAALQVVDIALPTFPDESMLHGDATPEITLERLAAAGVREIAIKNGPLEALCHGDGRSERIGAERVEAVDTTGAGDSFNGAYLAARLAGDTPPDAVRRAHRVAAAVIQTRGALAPFPVLAAAYAKPLSQPA